MHTADTAKGIKACRCWMRYHTHNAHKHMRHNRGTWCPEASVLDALHINNTHVTNWKGTRKLCQAALFT